MALAKIMRNGIYITVITIATLLISIPAKAQKEEHHKDLGNKYYEKGNYKRAISEYKNAIAIKVNYDVAYYNIGLAFNQLDEYDSAVTYFNRSLELNPDRIKTYLQRGEAYLYLGNYRACLPDLNRFISESEDSLSLSQAYELMGYSHELSDNYEIGYTAFDNSLNFRPNDTHLLYHRGLCANQIKKYEHAFDDLTKVVSERPEYENGLVQLGYTLIRLRRFDTAIDTLNRAINLNQKNALAYYYRGYAKWFLGLYKEADADKEQANQLGLKSKLWPKPD